VTERYDLVVIGGGSGGLAHAQRAAEYGASAAVVEMGPLGGTCVNVGCVPKKIMWYAAQQAHQFHHVADYGFDVEIRRHDWTGLKARRDAYIKRLNGIYQNNLDKRGVTRSTSTVAASGPSASSSRRAGAPRYPISPVRNWAPHRTAFSGSNPVHSVC
jgi:glutathione reductase (NADPH)